MPLKSTLQCGITRHFSSASNKLGRYESWNSYGTNDVFCEYLNGKKNGNFIRWYVGEGIMEECQYMDNVKHGKYTLYYRTGQVYKVCEYAKGVLSGKFMSWHKNGKKMIECEYLNGHVHGKFLSWHKNGQAFEEYMYDNGKIKKIISIKDQKGRETVLSNAPDIYVWKACRAKKGNDTVNVYVKMLLDKDVRRVTPEIDIESKFDDIYKSRVSSGRVVEITDESGNKFSEAESFVYRQDSLKYVVGQTVKPDEFHDEFDKKNGAGISVHAYKDHCDVWFTSSFH